MVFPSMYSSCKSCQAICSEQKSARAPQNSVAPVQALPNGTVIDHSFPNNAWHGHKVLQVDPGNGLLHVPLGAPCNDCPLDIAFGNISYGGEHPVYCSAGRPITQAVAAVSHGFTYVIS